MSRIIRMSAPVALGLMLCAPAFAVPPATGPHYNLNIIGFAQCTKDSDTDPDCFRGNAGDIVTNGHTIFVPLRTAQAQDICEIDGSILTDPITEAQLRKGVRILVSDGDDLQVTDRDATDGTARFTLPAGDYAIYVRPGGKPGGCMDIDTLLCFDCDPTLTGDVLECDAGDFVQVDCDPGLGNDQFVLTGHLNVDRTTGQQKWVNATEELIGGTGVHSEDYFDFFWQIFNSNLRLAQVRIYKLD